MQEVNIDKSLNLFAPIGGLVAWGFIEVDMVILIHLADTHSHAESATSLTDVWYKAATDMWLYWFLAEKSHLVELNYSTSLRFLSLR